MEQKNNAHFTPYKSAEENHTNSTVTNFFNAQDVEANKLNLQNMTFPIPPNTYKTKPIKIHKNRWVDKLNVEVSYLSSFPYL